MGQRVRDHSFIKTKYPWHMWTDGAQWKIYRGEDYKISTYNMQISLHGRARAQGVKVRSNSFTERSQDAQGWIRTREGLIFEFSQSEELSEPERTEVD